MIDKGEDMSILNDLIEQIEDTNLKERISEEVRRLSQRKSFGLVFEKHLPECTPVYDSPVKAGSTVAIKNGKVNDVYSWEQKLIEEEQDQNDFVCWIRNPPRSSWGLCIPCEINGETRPAYPDFLIIRKENSGYIVDVLEPHDPSRIDNLGKAKGFAEYAHQNPGVGRIQLIKIKRDAVGRERPFRLDMSKSMIRDKVAHCSGIGELNHIFDDYGFFQNNI